MKKNLVQTLLIQVLIICTLLTSCKKEEKATLPTVKTVEISHLSTNSAKAGGNISSDGGATITARGVCWGTTPDPTINDNKTSDGSDSDNFSSSITGLNAGTNYYVRAYATNSAGTSYGSSIPFITLGQAPAAVTLDITNISISSATFNAQVNANYLSTTVTFEYGTTTSYGQTTTANPNTVSGNTSTNVNSDVTGLTPGILYHVRVKTVNNLGTNYGDDVIFQTLGQLPTVSNYTYGTDILSKSATFNGTVNPNYLTTTVTFEYGLTNNYGQTVTASQNPVTGNKDCNVNAIITGLTANSTYHFRVKAVNELGTTYSNDWTFKTIGQLPSASSPAATSVMQNTATLKGVVIPNYLTTTVSFEYGTITSYGQTATSSQSPLNGDETPQNITADVRGLTANTTFHYRVIAVNELGTSYSNDATFTTFFGTVSDIDGNTYKTIKIGNQIWMAENLRTTKFNDGTSIPLVTSNLDWENINGPAYCWYGNDAATYKAIHGALYNWYAVNTGKLAPSGWHVPSDAEWKTLVDYLGGSSVAGGRMQDYYNKETGFSALLSGQRATNGTFKLINGLSYWWSSTLLYSTYGGLIKVSEVDGQTFSSGCEPSYGYSIRCLKD